MTLRERIHAVLNPPIRQRTVDVIEHKLHIVRDRAERRRQTVRDLLIVNKESELRQCVRGLLQEIELLRDELRYRLATYGEQPDAESVAAQLETMVTNARDEYEGVL